MKPYNYTMGVLVALLVAGTTAKSLTDSVNRDLESTNQINFLSTMLASITGFLILASDSMKVALPTGSWKSKRLALSLSGGLCHC